MTSRFEHNEFPVPVGMNYPYGIDYNQFLALAGAEKRKFPGTFPLAREFATSRWARDTVASGAVLPLLIVPSAAKRVLRCATAW
jgi:hypothetical protein